MTLHYHAIFDQECPRCMQVIRRKDVAMRHYAAVLDGGNVIVGFSSPEEVLETYGPDVREPNDPDEMRYPWFVEWAEVSHWSSWVSATVGGEPGEISPEGAAEMTHDALAGVLAAPNHLLLVALNQDQVTELFTALQGHQELQQLIAGALA